MMDEPKEGPKNFCILVTSSPESVNSRTLYKMAETAIGMGHNVQIFLMCDGVYHLLYGDFLSLIEKGAEVTLCAQNALERGIEKKPGILFGSQYDLAVMVSKSDGFLSLT